ncbi:MAG TPA: helix-turn-helix transcriptional regulator [Gemmatimonadaceae bacterium]|nr:helix-turn-helix transcriptional regulator [Gemmatimonadaceae bacterium]
MYATDVPDLAAVAAVMGDRTRAAMLSALMSGRPHTATELARAADVTKQTASSHLARLLDVQLVDVEAVGRHRHYRLAGRDVARTIEGLMRLARRAGAVLPRTGPSDPSLRQARVCYDHIAGEIGVRLYDGWMQAGHIRMQDRALLLTEEGERFFARLGIDVAGLRGFRRPLCLSCLDWSERRHHLAGALGAAILDTCLARGWARRHRGSRAMSFSATGERALLSR